MIAAFTINNQTTSNDYSDACTIEGAPLSTRVVLQVTGAAVVYSLANQGGAWGDEKFLTPVVGARSLICTGIRFKSAVANQPAQVSCEIVTPTLLGSGADTIASAGFTVAPDGTVGPVDTHLQTGDFFFSSSGADRANALLVNGRALNANTDTSLEELWELWGIYFGGTGKSDFLMPDAPGRALVVVGSHADVAALGDNDGLATASRTPKHNTTITDPHHSHAAAQGSFVELVAPGVGFNDFNTGNIVQDNAATAAAATGITAGPGGARPFDVVPFLALFLMVVK